jgi:hypothetical protein
MLGESLTTIITGNATIQAQIASRFRPLADAAEGFPSIYYIVRQIPHYTNNSQSMNSWRVSLLIVHNEYVKGWTLAKQVKTAMETAERHTINSVLYSLVKCTQIADEFEFPIGAYVVTVDFDITTNSII